MVIIIRYKIVQCVLHVTRTVTRRMALTHALRSSDNQFIFVRKSSAVAARMHAWQIQQYGGVDELNLNKSAHAITIKSPNELLVKVHAASVNPIDVRMLGKNIFHILL